MAQWIQQSNGRYLLVGSGRTSLIAERDFPSNAAFKVQLMPLSNGHGVFIQVLASKDGRSAYEIGFVGTDVVIRSVEFGDPASVVNRATDAHGLGSGVPVIVDVRFVNGKIEVRLNGSSTVAVEFIPGDSGSPDFSGYRHFGFCSNVDGAVVVSAQLCDLVPETVNRADLLISVCGGDVFQIEGTTKRLLMAGAFNSTGEVDLVEFEQKVYGVDGQHAKVIDIATGVVSDWAPTAGALPGATQDPDDPEAFLPGTTTARILALHFGRIWFAGMPGEPQNVYCTAVNDPLDIDTGSVLQNFGAAFGLTAAQIGLVGQPVTCLARSSRGTLIIGCVSSIWELQGDPTVAAPVLTEILSKCGISGKDAVTRLAEGRLVVLTPEGAYLIPGMGDPIPMSQSMFTIGLNIPREDIGDYIVQVRRDPATNTIHFLRTPRTSGTAEHVRYDERIGGFAVERGGWFPDNYESRFGPTASTPDPYLGKIVWGTRDGYLMVHDPDAQTDDGSTVIARVGLSLLTGWKIRRESILRKLTILPAAGSTVPYRVWGAMTPEKVYGAVTGRFSLMTGTANHTLVPDDRVVRAPSILIELYSDQALPMAVEDIDAVIDYGKILTNWDPEAAEAPEEPCEPPFFPGTDSSSAESEYSSGPGGYTTAYSTNGGWTEVTPTEITEGTPGTTSSSASSESLPFGFSGILPSEESDTLITTSSSGDTLIVTTEPQNPCTIVEGGVGDDMTICLTDDPGTIDQAGVDPQVIE